MLLHKSSLKAKPTFGGTEVNLNLLIFLSFWRLNEKHTTNSGFFDVGCLMESLLLALGIKRYYGEATRKKYRWKPSVWGFFIPKLSWLFLLSLKYNNLYFWSHFMKSRWRVQYPFGISWYELFNVVSLDCFRYQEILWRIRPQAMPIYAFSLRW